MTCAPALCRCPEGQSTRAQRRLRAMVALLLFSCATSRPANPSRAPNPGATPAAKNGASDGQGAHVVEVEPVSPATTTAAAEVPAPELEPELPSHMGRFTVLASADLRSPTGPGSHSPGVSSTGPRSAASSLLDHSRWRLSRTIAVGRSHLTQAGVSRDGSEVWVSSEADGTLRIYDLATGRALRSWSVPGYEPFGQGPSGSYVLSEWNTPKLSRMLYGSPAGLLRVAIVDPPAREQLSEDSVTALRWSEDGQILGSSGADNDGSRLSLSLVSGPRLGDPLVLRAPGRLEDWAVSSDRTLLVCLWFDLRSVDPATGRVSPTRDRVEAYDLSTHALLWQAEAPQYANGLDISPDGRFAAVVGSEVRLLDTQNGALLASFTELGNNAHAVRFHPSGDALAVSAYDGHLRILGIPAGNGSLPLLKDLRHRGTSNVYAIRFFDAGRQLLSSSGDQTLKIWHLGK